MNDQIHKIANIMAIQYARLRHNEIHDYDQPDYSWQIQACARSIDEKVPGFFAIFHNERRKYEDMLRNFTPEMVKEAEAMFAPQK